MRGLLLALALLFAQFGAIAHECSHLRSAHEHPPAPAPAGQVCPDCLAFAPLLAAAGGSDAALPAALPPASTAYPLLSSSLLPLSPRPAFRSRAPPQRT